MKVTIVVTHLLGTGHLARAMTLARAYAAVGDAVSVVSGGLPAPLLADPDITLVQLPPVRSDGVDFSRLLTTQNAPASSEYLAHREVSLLNAFSSFAPDILITELFPFGRRILRTEFQALLRAAKAAANPPLICASIRDILAPPSKPQKALFADDMVRQYYDAVLIHSDPDLMPLELSWPVSAVLRPYLHYTGFVAPPPAGQHPECAGAGEIIVSAGGGDVGDHIFETAIEMARDVALPVRLLIGGAAPDDRIAAWRSRAPVTVMIEPARRDFRQMLYHAAASVSLCGYNTAQDILQAGTPAVFIPFDEGNEVEQGIRADALARKSGIETIHRAQLSAQTLLAALTKVIAAPRRNSPLTVVDGAANTVTKTHNLRGGQ
ncbi:glycosyltransferase [Sulfitobacter sp. F26169L]|uniref:glycosyltransferase family protein n=1 Tax=Sulfitobacter sp. F26169L TaxID=2996015 RepID=UPI002260CBE5|nr:glycosyltransferase [Sulfitobacter sp. F26169L]MCX7567299.1 glycosyltransferase [Sulfitobacter sp. F26169L]